MAFNYHRAGRCHDHHGVISGFLADLNGQCHRFRHFASCYKQAQGYILCIYIYSQCWPPPNSLVPELEDGMGKIKGTVGTKVNPCMFWEYLMISYVFGED